MKKIITYLSALTIVAFTACSSSGNKTDNSEKTAKFLSNFETLKLPVSSSEIKKGGILENEFLDILTDTAGGFSRNYPDGEIHFTNEYYYFGKIKSDNNDFHIIIIGEMPTTGVLGLMPGALLEAKLYTISTGGKIISVIPLASFSDGENWGMTASINKNLEIETKEDKTITKYKIEQDGKITVVPETKKEEFTGTFKDSRDGKTYKIVKIGDQIWLAENFAYKPNNNEAILSKRMEAISDLGNFWVYDDKKESIKKYGYLYNYKAAQKSVPEGWHIPTKAEFETLLNHYGEKPYRALTTDKEGLSIVFSGWYFGESGYVQEGEGVGFWSANTDNENEEKAYACIIGKFDETSGYTSIDSRYMSSTGAAVRLIKNNPNSENKTVNTEKLKPIYEEFQDETPRTAKGNVGNIVDEYDDIIKGEGYTIENLEIHEGLGNVVLKKKNGEIKMIEISESSSRYDNREQYFYKNNELFYAYFKSSSSDRMDEEGIRIFTTEESKYYFADGKCSLFLFSNSEQNKEHPEYEPIGSDILKTSNEHLQRTEANKWNEY